MPVSVAVVYIRRHFFEDSILCSSCKGPTDLEGPVVVGANFSDRCSGRRCCGGCKAISCIEPGMDMLLHGLTENIPGQIHPDDAPGANSFVTTCEITDMLIGSLVDWTAKEPTSWCRECIACREWMSNAHTRRHIIETYTMCRAGGEWYSNFCLTQSRAAEKLGIPGRRSESAVKCNNTHDCHKTPNVLKLSTFLENCDEKRSCCRHEPVLEVEVALDESMLARIVKQIPDLHSKSVNPKSTTYRLRRVPSQDGVGAVDLGGEHFDLTTQVLTLDEGTTEIEVYVSRADVKFWRLSALEVKWLCGVPLCQVLGGVERNKGTLDGALLNIDTDHHETTPRHNDRVVHLDPLYEVKVCHEATEFARESTWQLIEGDFFRERMCVCMVQLDFTTTLPEGFRRSLRYYASFIPSGAPLSALLLNIMRRGFIVYRTLESTRRQTPAEPHVHSASASGPVVAGADFELAAKDSTRYCKFCDMGANGPVQFVEHFGSLTHPPSSRHRTCLRRCTPTEKERKAKGVSFTRTFDRTKEREAYQVTLTVPEVDAEYIRIGMPLIR